MLRLLRLS